MPKGLPGIKWTTDIDFSSLGGPKAGARGGVRFAMQKGYNPYTGKKTNKTFQQILDERRKKEEDPYGVEESIKKYNDRQDKDMAAYQQWSSDVSKGLETWLGEQGNLRSDLTARYEKQANDLATPSGIMNNAPTVGGSSGSVMNPNLEQQHAQAQTAANNSKALQKLTQLQGSSAWLDSQDWATAQMKNFKYQQSQIPKIYNAAKNKYESELRAAVKDHEQKKELAQIQANATMYAAQLSLLGNLTGQQAQNQRNLLDNTTDLQQTNLDNQSRERIAQMNNDAQTARANLKAQLDALKGDGRKREDTAWSAFMQGVRVVNQATGQEGLYASVLDGSGKYVPSSELLPGAVLPASEVFNQPYKGANVRKTNEFIANWVDIAYNDLYAGNKRAAAQAVNRLVNKLKHVPAAKRRQIIERASAQYNT